MDFDNLYNKIQEQITRLESNLSKFNELQKKTELSGEIFTRVSDDLRRLETDSRTKLEMYEKQFYTILHEINLRMEEFQFLREKLTGAQRDFTVFADKRIEDHKKTVNDRMNEIENRLKSCIDSTETIKQDIWKLGSCLDSSNDKIKVMENRLKHLRVFCITSFLILLILSAIQFVFG